MKELWYNHHMKKLENIKKIDREFSDTLVDWYNKERRILPWRETQDPYHILVSEIMLQQTQVNTVIPYYLRFLDELPTLESLAKASDEQLHRLWEGLGYYSRVFRLRQFAVEVQAKYNGRIPNEKSQLISLPGIGPYTCGAILSFAFHVKEPAIDGNVKRVLARLTNDTRDISKVATQRSMEDLVHFLLPEDPYAFNQGLIELGATYCRPRQPRCQECPVRTFCEGYANGHVEDLPNKPKKKKQKEVSLPIFVFHQNQEMLFVKRASEGLLASLWGFPMIEEDFVEDIESEVNAFLQHRRVQDYMDEQFGIRLQPTSVQRVGPIKHVFSHVIWNMHLFLIEDPNVWNRVDTIESPETIKSTDQDISLPTAFKKCVEFIYEKELI